MRNFENFEQNLISIPHPEMINLSIKTVCNMKCIMCYNWKTPQGGPFNISTKRWIEITSELRKEYPQKGISLAFTGSESLLFKDIFSLIEHANNIGFDVWLHTNGSLISKEVSVKLKKAGLKNVSISLDSLIPEEHNFMRGTKKSYDMVLKAIDTLYNTGLKNITITTVICPYNITHIEKLIKWVENNPKLLNITLQAIIQPFNTKPDPYWLKSNEFSHLWPDNIKLVTSVLDKIIKNKEKYKKLVNTESQLSIYKKYFKNPLIFVNHFGCNVKSKHINIGSSGNLSICPYETSGHINDESFQKVWHSDKHIKIYQEMDNCTKNCHLLLNCAFEEITFLKEKPKSNFESIYLKNYELEKKVEKLEANIVLLNKKYESIFHLQQHQKQVINKQIVQINQFRNSIIYPFYKITSRIGKTKQGKIIQKPIK